MGAAASISATEISLQECRALIRDSLDISEEWKSDVELLLDSWVPAVSEKIKLGILQRFYKKGEDAGAGGGCFIDKEFDRVASIEHLGLENVIFVPCSSKQESKDSIMALTHKSIVQGKMGDCFLVASLAALLSPHVLDKHPDLLNSIIRSSGFGKWSVNLYDKNEPITVEVDSLLPLNGGGFDHYKDSVFASSPSTPLFSLIEKGFAKHFGAYWRLQGGNVEETLGNLLARPIDDIHFTASSFSKSPEKYKKLISLNIKLGNVLCCGNIDTELNGNDSTYTSLGVTLNHAFALVRADESHVWLYNPHGHDNHFKGGSEDGELKLTWKEFGKNINRLQICYLDEGRERKGYWVRTLRRGAGGASNHKSFADNDVLVFDVEKDMPLDELVLMFGQEDMRGSRQVGEKLSYKEIGITVVGIKKKEGGEVRATSLERRENSHVSEIMASSRMKRYFSNARSLCSPLALAQVTIHDFNMLTPERYAVLAKTEAFANKRDTCLRVSKRCLKGHKLVGLVFSYFDKWLEEDAKVWVATFRGGESEICLGGAAA
ncbi:hypothetical protein TrCOL_g2053 [Triparma columacea]|uniref:Calpain catalytic domain-containing protein n=1 Tax=Triparma columacea TaxID=722753 RepID=A0A9W7GM34_9STRA|nr:hypothetical protein TrCOL_g2053 [Triparma columacea]